MFSMDRTSGQPEAKLSFLRSISSQKPKQLALPGEYLPWKIGGKAAKLLMMSFSYCTTC
jgi:hypothetical protein